MLPMHAPPGSLWTVVFFVGFFLTPKEGCGGHFPQSAQGTTCSMSRSFTWKDQILMKQQLRMCLQPVSLMGRAALPGSIMCCVKTTGGFKLPFPRPIVCDCVGSSSEAHHLIKILTPSLVWSRLHLHQTQCCEGFISLKYQIPQLYFCPQAACCLLCLLSEPGPACPKSPCTQMAMPCELKIRIKSFECGEIVTVGRCTVHLSCS